MSWPRALDALEAHLEAQAAAIGRGDHDAIVGFAPPSDLGPLPVELGERALSLLALATELERSVADQLEALARVRRRPETGRRRAAPGPRFVDATG